MGRLSNNFFFAAILLALFGVAAMNQGGPYGSLEVLLALAMAGAGLGLRTGAVEAWWFGVGASAVTVAVGAWLLVEVGFYVPGTIIAIFALLQLFSVRPGTAPHPVAAPSAPPVTPVSWVPPVPPVLPAQAPPAADANDFFGGRVAERRD
jgi:hypothetical protein